MKDKKGCEADALAYFKALTPAQREEFLTKTDEDEDDERENEDVEKSVFDPDELRKAIEDLGEVADSQQLDLPSAASRFDSSPEVEMAKSLDAGDFVRSWVDATVGALDATNDGMRAVADDQTTLAKATLVIGQSAVANAERLERIEALVKALGARLNVPTQPKGARSTVAAKPLRKAFSGGGERLEKAEVLDRLAIAFERMADGPAKSRLGKAIQLGQGGDMTSAVELLEEVSR